MIRRVEFGSGDYAEMLRLRCDMLRKPLGFGDFLPADLEGEDQQMHVAAFQGARVVGGCVLVQLGHDTAKLRQMFVLPETQGTGLGRRLVQFAEGEARRMGAKRMTMHARVSAQGFYEKLGYHPVGDVFGEVSIPHIVMEKDIPA